MNNYERIKNTALDNGISLNSEVIDRPLSQIKDLETENEKLKIGNETLKEKLVISANSDKSILKMIKPLDEIEKIVNEPCIEIDTLCKECDFNCEHKDILAIINKAKEQ